MHSPAALVLHNFNNICICFKNLLGVFTLAVYGLALSRYNPSTQASALSLSLSLSLSLFIILQLSINAFDYNCHVDLIKLLRQEGKLHRLRKARQKMSELFPLTEEIWLDWLKDEIRLTEGEESEREKIYELFEKAVKDYICPDIWLEFAQYSIGGMGAEGGISRVRSIFERALTAVGLHMTKGAALWEAYREFEIAILSTLQQEQLDAQLERIHTLFRRQLAIPLLDMEGTYAEYSDWAEQGVPEMVMQHYKRAAQHLEKSRPYEEALLVSEPPKLAEYQGYIDYEMKEGDPARVQIIFERALAENCLVPDLWAKYTTYLDRQLKIKDLVLSCHERGVRNCPWTMGLWKSYLLALERHGAEHHIVSDVFEKALNAGFIQATDYVEIWQSYLDYLRRRVDFNKEGSRELEELRSAFSRCLDYLKQDVEETVLNFSTNVLLPFPFFPQALHCKNMQKARELWDSIMTKGNAKYANMWLEYYNLERSYGDAAHCRKALHRAVQCTTDYPEHVCEVLLTFERVEGSLEDWDVAVQKTESRLNRVNEQRVKAAEKEALIARQEEDRVEQRRKAKADKKAQKKSQKTNRTGDKRKAEDDVEDEWGEETEMSHKRHRGEDNFSPAVSEEQMETESGLFGRRAPPPRKAEPPAPRKNQQAIPESAVRKISDIPPEQRKDSNSVFVSNLSFTMEEPEAKMKAVFNACGTVVEVRPVYTAKGAFRGYCYVQFEDELAAQEALKLDRVEVDARPMYVSPCVDKSKNPDSKIFKYNTSMEKHKIFISGLPYTYTKEQLEELCKEHGGIKAVRLVTNRAGKSKVIHNLYISAMYICTKLTVQHFLYRGKGRTQVSLLPRSLHRQSVPEAKTENGTTAKQQDGITDGQGTKSLSNEDFARMLLKK
uniref:Spliceosome associated factor 3, U4/U6 recycling protein n=1 Tax=Astyanax mexicanus TaxID=7994 RepID=A0A8B9J8T3_ASTMX